MKFTWFSASPAISACKISRSAWSSTLVGALLLTSKKDLSIVFLFFLRASLSRRSRALPVTAKAVVKSHLTCDSFVPKLNMFFKKTGSAFSAAGSSQWLTFSFSSTETKEAVQRQVDTGTDFPSKRCPEPYTGPHIALGENLSGLSGESRSWYFLCKKSGTYFHYKVPVWQKSLTAGNVKCVTVTFSVPGEIGRGGWCTHCYWAEAASHTQPFLRRRSLPVFWCDAWSVLLSDVVFRSPSRLSDI